MGSVRWPRLPWSKNHQFDSLVFAHPVAVYHNHIISMLGHFALNIFSNHREKVPQGQNRHTNRPITLFQPVLVVETSPSPQLKDKETTE